MRKLFVGAALLTLLSTAAYAQDYDDGGYAPPAPSYGYGAPPPPPPQYGYDAPAPRYGYAPPRYGYAPPHYGYAHCHIVYGAYGPHKVCPHY